MVGYSQENGNDDFAVVRHNRISWTSSFDADGKVTTAIGTFDDLLHTVSRCNPMEDLVVAGVSYWRKRHEIAVVRYNTDGSLDTGFGGDGAATTAVGMAGA